MMHEHEPRFSGDTDDVLKFFVHPGVMRVAGAFALALFIASFLPPVFVAGTLRDLLMVAAFASAAAATLRQDNAAEKELTRWDEAAVLALLSLLSGAFSDAEAVAEALEALHATAAAPSAGMSP